MRLIDVHCHLESDLYKNNLDEIIRESNEAGIIKLITSSIIPEQWPISQKISEKYESVEYALGIHPWYIKKEYYHLLSGLINISSSGACAIGEIGLDKKIDKTDFEMQIQFFKAQLEIAADADLPVIVHCRGAYNELIEILKKFNNSKISGIIHSFSGNAEIAKILIKHNFSFSFGGSLTFRNSKKKQEALKIIYPHYFLLETDSPDIPPVEINRGTNYPKYIHYNLLAASEIIGLPVEEIAETSFLNAVKIFRFKI